MQYYNDEIAIKSPNLYKYFYKGITNNQKHIGHCLLFWGEDIKLQCELALEIARLLNCTSEDKQNCDCLNCRWIKEQTHPAVKIYTRLDFKVADSNSASDDSKSTGQKNITIEQAKQIINELTISSNYHRVYIFCDRDKEGNLLPLNKINLPDATSNALLKTFEEPSNNATFIFLTKSPSDIISTIVSRAQSFFVPSSNPQTLDYDLVKDVVANYWTIQRADVIEFENKLYALAMENDSIDVLKQFQNYILSIIQDERVDKLLFYNCLEDIKSIEKAIQQLSLATPMLLQHVIEDLAFNLILK